MSCRKIHRILFSKAEILSWRKLKKFSLSFCILLCRSVWWSVKTSSTRFLFWCLFFFFFFKSSNHYDKVIWISKKFSVSETKIWISFINHHSHHFNLQTFSFSKSFLSWLRNFSILKVSLSFHKKKKFSHHHSFHDIYFTADVVNKVILARATLHSSLYMYRKNCFYTLISSCEIKNMIFDIDSVHGELSFFLEELKHEDPFLTHSTCTWRKSQLQIFFTWLSKNVVSTQDRIKLTYLRSLDT